AAAAHCGSGPAVQPWSSTSSRLRSGPSRPLTARFSGGKPVFVTISPTLRSFDRSRHHAPIRTPFLASERIAALTPLSDLPLQEEPHEAHVYVDQGAAMLL